MNDKLNDLPPQERDDRVADLYKQASRQLGELSAALHRKTWQWAAIGVLAAFLLLGAVVETIRHRSRIDDIERISNQVERHSNANTQSLTKWSTESLLRNEKVCTETNRGEPCRALFERLSRDITPRQQRILACGVLEAVAQTPDVVRLQKMTLCHRFQVVDTP